MQSYPPSLPANQPAFLEAEFDPEIAGRAVVAGLKYLQGRLGWSGSKIARVLHLSPNTINLWIKNGSVPISNPALQPDVQAILHLIGVHKNLEAMFSDSEQQQMWLLTLHPELNAVPLELMSESMEGLIFVRQYLDYVRGRGA